MQLDYQLVQVAVSLSHESVFDAVNPGDFRLQNWHFLLVLFDALPGSLFESVCSKSFFEQPFVVLLDESDVPEDRLFLGVIFVLKALDLVVEMPNQGLVAFILRVLQKLVRG